MCGSKLIVSTLLFAAGVVSLLATPTGAVPVPGDRISQFAALTREGEAAGWEPGRVTVLTFCAFWCDTWKEQTRRLAEAQGKLKGLQVDFVTISVDGRWSELGDGKIIGQILLDPDRTLISKLGIKAIPFCLVIDKGGVIRYAVQGIVRTADIVDSVKKCVFEAPSANVQTIYLTFDDFPSLDNKKQVTPGASLDERLLDLLEKEDVCATFFCVCNRLDEYSNITRRAYSDGNALQIHSWDHQTANPDLIRCSEVIKKLVGVSPTLYRPAGTDKCLNLKGEKLVAPVVNPYDYTRPGKEELKRRILHAVKPGSIILLHSGVSETVDVLPQIIASLKQRGFRFEVLR